MEIGEKNRISAWSLWLQIAIVAFWAVTASVLVKRTWFSDESGMVLVDPEKILGMFFTWTEGAELTILKEGRRAGQMSLSSQVAKDLPDGNSDDIQREISMAGTLEGISSNQGEEKGGGGEEIYWRGVIAVKEDLNFPKGDFVLKMSQAGLSAQFGFDQFAETISLNVKSGGETLIQYQGKPGGLSKLPELGWMGRFLPLDSLLTTEGLSAGVVKAWAPEIVGRYGSATIAGRKMLVYQLTFRAKGSTKKPGPEIKLYLSEAGEPLMIQTAWGYEALAEVLVPAEIYDNSIQTSQ